MFFFVSLPTTRCWDIKFYPCLYVRMYFSQLVSVRSLTFALSNSFEIDTQGEEPLKEGQIKKISF